MDKKKCAVALKSVLEERGLWKNFDPARAKAYDPTAPAVDTVVIAEGAASSAETGMPTIVGGEDAVSVLHAIRQAGVKPADIVTHKLGKTTSVQEGEMAGAVLDLTAITQALAERGKGGPGGSRGK